MTLGDVFACVCFLQGPRVKLMNAISNIHQRESTLYPPTIPPTHTLITHSHDAIGMWVISLLWAGQWLMGFGLRAELSRQKAGHYTLMCVYYPPPESDGLSLLWVGLCADCVKEVVAGHGVAPHTL